MVWTLNIAQKSIGLWCHLEMANLRGVGTLGSGNLEEW
jgi:hypothetical protein